MMEHLDLQEEKQGRIPYNAEIPFVYCLGVQHRQRLYLNATVSIPISKPRSTKH